MTRVNRILGGCLASMAVLDAQVAAHGQQDPSAIQRTRPTAHCSLPGVTPDEITWLGIQYLNNGIPAPAAFLHQLGSLDESGSARFRVYALTDDVRYYCDVTAAFGAKLTGIFHGSRLRLHLSPLELRFGRRPFLRISEDADGPYLEYTPGLRPIPRTERMTFALHLPRPANAIAGNFYLAVPAQPGTGPLAAPGGAKPNGQ
jgi:hypothetical protein